MSDDLDVSGGVGGIEAHYASMLRYATVLDDAGDVLLEANGSLLGLTVDGDLAEAAIMCPLEVGGIESALAAATVGPDSALWASGEFEVLARFLRGAVDAYAFTDEAQAFLLDFAQDSAGFLFGAALPGLALGGALLYLSDPSVRAAVDQLGLTDPATLNELLYDNPWLLEALTRMAPGMVQGLAFTVSGLLGPFGPPLLSTLSGGNWPAGDYESAISGLIALAGLGGAFQDTGDFTVGPVDGSSVELDIGADTMVAQVFEQQQLVGADDGQIQIVQIDRGPGLPPSYIVQIPGTQDWSPSRGDNPIDLTSNVQLMAGNSTVSQEQIAAAMRQAGIGPDNPVMLTGHSQGGITAASMAANPRFQSEFDIDSVVTGGSPIGRFDLPDDVSVMSLEHEQDAVPMLDGTSNPDRENWTTVRRDLDAEAADVGAAHGTDLYRRTGALVDRSDDPSISRWRDENSAFVGTGVATRYQIETKP